jgi:hypothetical protein
MCEGRGGCVRVRVAKMFPLSPVKGDWTHIFCYGRGGDVRVGNCCMRVGEQGEHYYSNVNDPLLVYYQCCRKQGAEGGGSRGARWEGAGTEGDNNPCHPLIYMIVERCS